MVTYVLKPAASKGLSFLHTALHKLLSSNPCTHGEGLVNWWASFLMLLCRGLICDSLSLKMLVENKSSLTSNIQGKSTSFGIVDGTGDWDSSEIRLLLALVSHQVIISDLAGPRWTPSPLCSSSPAPKRGRHPSPFSHVANRCSRPTA